MILPGPCLQGPVPPSCACRGLCSVRLEFPQKSFPAKTLMFCIHPHLGLNRASKPGHFSGEGTGTLQLALITVRAGRVPAVPPQGGRTPFGASYEPSAAPGAQTQHSFAPDLCSPSATVQMQPFDASHLAVHGGIARVTLPGAIRGLEEKQSHPQPCVRF